MTITGIHGTTSINISTVNYYYQSGTNIFFKHVNGDTTYISFADYYTARKSADAFFKINYKQLATIPDVNGSSYVINVENVQSFSGDGTSLTIIFLLTILTVTGINSVRTLQDTKYLGKVIYGYNFLSTFSGVRKYVNQDGSEDYVTITAALSAAAPGSAVIVRSGVYDEGWFMTDIPVYLEEGVTILKTVTFNAQSVGSMLLGHGDFINNFSSFSGNTGTDCYIEFRNVTGGDKTFYWFNGIAKGNSIQPGGNFITVMLDTDGTAKFDIDIVSVFTGFSGEVTFIQYSNDPGFCTLRNGHFESRVMNINSNYVHQSMQYNLINVRFVTTMEYDSVNFMCVVSSNRDDINIWNSIFISAGTYNFLADATVNVNLFGDVFANKGESSNVELRGSSWRIDGNLSFSNYSITENINFITMLLTNKPRPSLHSLNSTVYFRDNKNIKSGAVLRTRTIVSNKTLTTNGEQIDYYKIAGQGEREFREGELFASVNELLASEGKKFFNVSISNHLLRINSIDSFEGGNTDLAGISWDNFNFKNSDLINPNTEFSFADSYVGYSKFSGCTFMDSQNTKTLFRAAVRAYHPLTTIWKDNRPIDDWRGLNLTGVNLSAADLSGVFTDRTNFTGATMPANCDTKPEFKALVGSWDAVTTIWTDGLPVGE